MNQGEGVAVAGDFLLGSISRRCLVEHDFFQLGARGFDAFNAVRRLGRFDPCGLSQSRQGLGGLLAEKVLLSAVGAEGMTVAKSPRSKGRRSRNVEANECTK